MPGYLRTDRQFELETKYFDPVEKLRVSEPESLIDTDFEYGMQISKWENLDLLNNRPFAYPSSNVIPNVSGISLPEDSRTVTVTTSSAHGLTPGLEIAVQDTVLTIANGNFIVETVPTDTTFTYTARALNNSSTITNILDLNKTAIYLGTSYTNAAIGGTPTLSYSGTAITVTTTVPHGLAIGNEIAITGISASTNAPNGSFFVARIISATQFVYYANAIPTGTLTGGTLYVRPQAQFLHRPFDGGVIFSANSSSNNQQAIRQTRRYFRYQSGKGLQLSSGTVMKPNLQIESLTSSGTLVTVQTKEQHNLQPGSIVKVFGANEADYNGTFALIEILSYNTFTYEALAEPSTPIATGNYYVTLLNWYGCTNRIGMFDSQNGVFFEFDGQDLYAVRRNSVYQLSGRVTVTNGSNTVTQTDPTFGTNFSGQLSPGDFIVIRGQSYRVETIANDTSMTITPSYRGATSTYVQYSKTIDYKIKQNDWNIDTMDGTGPSGYTLDLTKMQMFYIDYSWYGAGYIRWGLRGIDGSIYYVHKELNNNVNSEAYMRSGNLPARYESNTFGKVAKLASNLSNSATTITVNSTEGFSPAGTLMIRSGTTYEHVNYTGKTATTFTGVIRARAGATADVTIAEGSNLGTVASTTGLQVGQRAISSAFPANTYISEIAGNVLKFNTAAISANPTGVIFPPMSSSTPQTFTYSTTSPIAIEQAFPTYSASLSHWGTSVIMDGRYDDDKSLIFTFGQTIYTNIPASATATTTATGSAGTKTITVASATNLVVGMSISGDGVQAGTVVTDIVSTTITLSLSLTASLSSTSVTFTGGNSKALFSIRVAPSVDNGIAAGFGQRDLINRMQLTLRSVGVTTKTANSNMLVTAVLNGVPSSSTQWTNAIRNATNLTNSSLAQLADYAGLNTIVLGGELTGGFFVNDTSSIDLTDVRELGNSILGGGGNFANTSIYPDGPDVLTLVVTNLSSTAIDVLGRLGWSEAQA